MRASQQCRLANVTVNITAVVKNNNSDRSNLFSAKKVALMNRRNVDAVIDISKTVCVALAKRALGMIKTVENCFFSVSDNHY